MKYKIDVLNKLRDSDNWPAFDRPDFLEKLNDVADDAFTQKTIEGYLAALLIYHQLCEEMMKVLIQCSSFLIQCSVFPHEIKSKRINRLMFGQIINELEKGILDTDTKQFIEKSKKLNSIRIKMVHKLTDKTSLNSIERQIKPAKKLFDELFKLFDDIYDDYRVAFSHYKKNIEDLEELVDEE